MISHCFISLLAAPATPLKIIVLILGIPSIFKLNNLAAALDALIFPQPLHVREIYIFSFVFTFPTARINYQIPKDILLNIRKIF